MLWKWAVKLFRMKWFRHKEIDEFLKEGEIMDDEYKTWNYDGKLWKVQKCFQTVKDGYFIASLDNYFDVNVSKELNLEGCEVPIRMVEINHVKGM